MRRLLIAAAYLAVCVGLAVAIAGAPNLGDDAAVVEASAAPVTSTTSSTTALSTATTTTTTTTDAKPSLRAPEEVRVRFYNGSTKAGAATLAGKKAVAAGYPVETPGESVGKRPSQVLFTEGWEQDARALAKALGLSDDRVVALGGATKLDGLAPAVVGVVVGDDLLALLG